MVSPEHEQPGEYEAEHARRQIEAIERVLYDAGTYGMPRPGPTLREQLAGQRGRRHHEYHAEAAGLPVPPPR